MASSKHANNKREHVLVLGQDFIQKIDDTTIYAEKECIHLILLLLIKHLAEAFNYNDDDSYFLLIVKKSLSLKPKPKCISKTIMNCQEDRKSTAIYGYFDDFSVDYRAIANDKILEEYSIKHWDLLKMCLL